MRWLASCALLAVVAGPSVLRADEVVDAAAVLPAPPSLAGGSVPLSEPIAPVPSPGSPWQFALTTAAGVADPFYGKLALLASARRGLGDFGLEVFGGRAFSWEGPALDLCSRPGACTIPSGTQLAAVPGQLEWLGGAGGIWRVGQGKVSVGGLSALGFALEVGLGGAAVTYRVVEQSLWGPGARLSLGVGSALRPDLALRLELSHLLYRTDIRGVVRLDGQTFAGLALSWAPGGGR